MAKTKIKYGFKENWIEFLKKEGLSKKSQSVHTDHISEIDFGVKKYLSLIIIGAVFLLGSIIFMILWYAGFYWFVFFLGIALILLGYFYGEKGIIIYIDTGKKIMLKGLGEEELIEFRNNIK